MKNPKVSVIIVYYKGIDKLLSCISSVFTNTKKVSYEVIVVDNTEERDIEKKIKKVEKDVVYLKAPRNLGYGAGNNLGSSFARGKYLFILNPDTELTGNSLKVLCDFLDKNSKAAIVAPNLVKADKSLFEKMGSRRLTPLRGVFVFSFLNKLIPNNRFSSEYYLKNIDQTKLREVGSVPGSAFMIRSDVFSRVGKFDENIFLYLEEEDLGKRVNEAGYKLFIEPKARIIHYWTSSKVSKTLRKVFLRSRFYYFKKHYGLVNALLVESVARLSKWNVSLVLIVVLAALLRLWRITETMELSGDYGWYYLSAKQLLVSRKLPLVGIPSSVPVLKQGAFFTWFLAAALFVGNYHPVSGAILVACVGILGILGVYLLFSELFNRRVAVISCLLIATSPQIVHHDRTPFLLAFIYPITLLIVWSASKIVKGQKKHYFIIGLLIAILYQFELAGFIFAPIVLVSFIWNKLKYKHKNALLFLFGLIAGLTPFIVWDIKQGIFLQTVGFAGWVVIKIFEGIGGFLGGGFSVNTKQFMDTVSRLVFVKSSIVAVSTLLFSFGYFVKKYILERKPSYHAKLIVVWILVGLLSFYVRGTFSEAYMPLLYIPMICTVAVFLNYLLKKWFVVGIIITLFIISLNATYSVNKYFMKGVDYLSDRIKVSKMVNQKASGRRYQLTYIGSNDEFPSGGANYEYLLWWLGNEPVRRSELDYAIAEYPGVLGNKYTLIHDFGYIKVGEKHD